MKNHVIFIIGIITVLVGNKLWEIFTSFDMVIDPVGTTIKMIVLFVITMELIKHIFRTEREKARN